MTEKEKKQFDAMLAALNFATKLLVEVQGSNGSRQILCSEIEKCRQAIAQAAKE